MNSVCFVAVVFDSHTVRGQSALSTEQVFRFLGPTVSVHGSPGCLLLFSYVTTLATLYKPNNAGVARLWPRLQGLAGAACSRKYHLGISRWSLNLSSSLLELLLLLRLLVLLRFRSPVFHKALIAHLGIVSRCPLRLTQPHAEKRYGQSLPAVVPHAEPLPSFLWRLW